MQRTILSTADVARLFKVTETTVKRWADEGTMKCQKTPGGHRKFEIRQVIAFARENNFDPVGALAALDEVRFSHSIQMAVLTRDFDTLVKAFVGRALSPSKTDLYAFLSYLYEHKIHLWELYDCVLRPGMAEIGNLWVRGEINVNHEHRASYETMDALAKLQAQIFIKPSVNRTVVCACLGEEMHEIGLRCAANLFESEGWTVHYVGARTPPDGLVSSIEETRPDVVSLSITRADQPPVLAEAAARITAVSQLHRVTVIAGGAGATSLGDGTGILLFHSSRELLEFIESYSSRKIAGGSSVQ